MEKPLYPDLAELSKLVLGHSKLRVTPATKIQRILAVVHSEISRADAVRAFQLLQISPGEAEFVSIVVAYPLTRDKSKVITDQILQYQVDIVIVESNSAKTELEPALPKHSMPHFIVAPDLTVSGFESIGIRRIIDDRRSAFR